MDINKYLDEINIIYWINLDRSENRRNYMINNVLNYIDIPNERIIAVDGKNETDKNIYNNFISDTHFVQTKSEYACLLSHLNTIKKFSESEHQLALILEDDVTLEYAYLWNKKISEIINNAPKDWDIIMLNYIFVKKKLELDYTYNLNGTIYSAQAYLINKNGALKLMNTIYKNNKYILLPHYKHCADNYIYSLLKTYAYKYPYFTYSHNNDSTIHPTYLIKHLYSKFLTFSVWNNNKISIYTYIIYMYYFIKYLLILIINSIQNIINFIL